jgi:menaquinone-9 beta-reductase
MNVYYDVIIIGAGPAGACCAKNLVKNGIKTLIIEKKKLPRYKCCAGYYTKESMDLIDEFFGKIPENLYCQVKEVKYKYSGSGKKFLDEKSILFNNLKRYEVDYWMVNESKTKVIDNCTFNNFTYNNDNIQINCSINGNLNSFYCKYLIGADGAYSKVRRQIDSSYNKTDLLFAEQSVYNGNFLFDENYYYAVFNKKFSDKAYAWFLKKDDLYYIGTAWAKNDKYFIKWFDFLKERYCFNLNFIRRECCYIENSFDKNVLFGKNNIILIGEAAGLISIGYEGITLALLSGHHAANAILQKNDVIEKYRKSINDKIEKTKELWNKLRK